MSKRKTNKKYKDTMFRLLFKGKKELLSLYNATNGSNYENEDDLEENVPPERIIEKLVQRFELMPEKAKEYFDKVSLS